ncbi:chloride channel protein [Lysobacter maris]|uniref:Chloride channel protein n=2 Tax=Marilutibacter maris TaxID=1605891 RepID=A0A508ATW7_9GAMM|nr:chloride channel protein [Lysobacter maris]
MAYNVAMAFSAPTPPDPDGDGPAQLWSREAWKRRLALWGGAIAVALAAIVFAKIGDAAFEVFLKVTGHSPWWALLLTPATFAALAWATRGGLAATRGSGIPQVIASLRIGRDEFRAAQLSLKVSALKLLLTVVSLLGGASVGREGPTVHVGAGIMHAIGRRLGYSDPYQASRFLLAGGAAGIAAAFNTPLAGVVFAIEELSGAFEQRFSGTLLTAVIVGGVVSMGLLGDYAYFGHIAARLPLGQGWLAILACGVLCGVLGGLFSRIVIAAADGRPRWLGRMRGRHPVWFSTGCGLALALLGIALGGSVFGTGYEQAQALLVRHDAPGAEFGIAKFAANLVSYLAGIPGGLFSPALAVGAGLGDNLTGLFPGVDPSAIVLLGMCAYLAGVTQAPLTSAVISMELTDNHELLLPILATVLIARACSSLCCPTPIYKALAQRLAPRLQPPPTTKPADD